MCFHPHEEHDGWINGFSSQGEYLLICWSVLLTIFFHVATFHVEYVVPKKLESVKPLKGIGIPSTSIKATFYLVHNNESFITCYKEEAKIQSSLTMLKRYIYTMYLNVSRLYRPKSPYTLTYLLHDWIIQYDKWDNYKWGWYLHGQQIIVISKIWTPKVCVDGKWLVFQNLIHALTRFESQNLR